LIALAIASHDILPAQAPAPQGGSEQNSNDSFESSFAGLVQANKQTATGQTVDTPSQKSASSTSTPTPAQAQALTVGSSNVFAKDGKTAASLVQNQVAATAPPKATVDPAAAIKGSIEPKQSATSTQITVPVETTPVGTAPLVIPTKSTPKQETVSEEQETAVLETTTSPTPVKSGQPQVGVHTSPVASTATAVHKTKVASTGESTEKSDLAESSTTGTTPTAPVSASSHSKNTEDSKNTAAPVITDAETASTKGSEIPVTAALGSSESIAAAVSKESSVPAVPVHTTASTSAGTVHKKAGADQTKTTASKTAGIPTTVSASGSADPTEDASITGSSVSPLVLPVTSLGTKTDGATSSKAVAATTNSVAATDKAISAKTAAAAKQDASADVSSTPAGTSSDTASATVPLPTFAATVAAEIKTVTQAEGGATAVNAGLTPVAGVPTVHAAASTALPANTQAQLASLGHEAASKLPADSTSSSSEPYASVQATPTSLEVGIPGGTQGWLKIRAEVGTDGIHASLSSSSAAGQSMLREQLPAINAYLQSEHINASTRVAERSLSDTFPSGGQQDSGMAGSGGQQQTSDSNGQKVYQPTFQGPETKDSSHGALTEMAGNMLLPVQTSGSGSWLNVLA